MKTPKSIKLVIIATLILSTSLTFKSYSQQYYLNNSNSELKVFGTSNIHDWHINIEEQKGFIIINKTDNLTISKLKIEVVAESLKSGKKGMDKNTYKALDTENYKTITFQINEIKNTSKIADNKYKVETNGNLTISGVTKKMPLQFNLSLVNNEVHLSGEKIIKMTDFNIEPPKALFGTITTGDEVTIKFNSTFNN